MTTWRGFANRPWHTETEFEACTRLAVGTGTNDDVTPTIWSDCRNNAENIVLSYFMDSPRPIRMMLNRIPGELMPQHGKIQSDGEYSYSVQIPCMISTPSQYSPNVWKNLSGRWGDRFDTDPLTVNVDYTISGNTITLSSAAKGDVYCVEYETTLNPLPGLLKSFSLDRTADYLLVKKYGHDHARVQQWAEQYGNHIIRQLEMLRDGKIEIPEIARVNLFADWEEGSQNIISIPIGRV
jgi:hypothetical protein